MKYGEVQNGYAFSKTYPKDLYLNSDGYNVQTANKQDVLCWLLW